MSDEPTGTGWQPLSRPTAEPTEVEQGRRRLNTDGSSIVSPFVRLARTHAFHAAGEASVLVTLAGTLLTIDPNDARSRILLALVLTMAPFALVGPLIGPALDRIRGGRRATIAFSLFLRAALVIFLTRNLDTSWFFPIAFVWLVMGKTYSVAKAATVPTTVDSHDELVDKNSRLAILSAVAGVVGVAPAALLYQLFGATPTLWFAAIIYLLGVAASTQLPRVIVDDPEVVDDDHDIRSAGVRMASIVMACMRGIVGFVFFLLVFEFVRSELPDLSGRGTAVGAAVKHALGFDLLEEPALPWWKAAIPFALWGFGGFAGNAIAPWFRKRFSEERILVGAVAAVALAAVAAVWSGGLSGAALVALVVGAGASAAKLAFDSLVQRDAPGANHGAAFGRFETTFQIAWVIGSLIPVIRPIPLRGGFLLIAIAAVGIGFFIAQQGAQAGLAFGTATGAARPRRARRGESPDGTPGTAEAEPQPQPREVVAQHGVGTPQPMKRTAPPTTQVPAVSTDVYREPTTDPYPDDYREPTADPYAEAFADRKVEPPDWAAAVFGDESPNEPAEQNDPPSWLDEPNPTPPMGTDRIE